MRTIPDHGYAPITAIRDTVYSRILRDYNAGIIA